MAFQVDMTQNKINCVLSLLIPNVWQTNSAPMEFEGLHSVFPVHQWQVMEVINIIWKNRIWKFEIPALTWHTLDSVSSDNYWMYRVKSVLVSAAHTLFDAANKMGMGEKPGWVVGELLIMWLPWQPHQAIPKPQQLSGEAAAAGQGREQTCEQPQLQGGTLTGSNSSSGGTGSRAGPDVPTGLLQAPELLSGTCSLCAGSKGSVGDSPVPVCSLRCDVWGYSRDEDVLCAGEHGLEEVAPTLSPYLGATSSHMSHKHFSILLFLPHRWCRFSRGKFSRPSSSGSGLCICVQPQQMSDCKEDQAWVVLGRCSHSCSQFPHHQWALATERALSNHFHSGMAEQPGRTLPLHPQGSLQQLYHS